MRSLLPALFLCFASLPATADWTHWGGDAHSTKFSPLDQIHAGNVDSLKILWRYRLPDHAMYVETEGDLPLKENKGTPIVIDGVMYTLTPYGFVVALDAASGEERWRFDSRSWAGESSNQWIHRGVAYWSDGDGAERILFGTSADTLYSLDAETGLPDPDFGNNGRVDLTKGARRPIDPGRQAISSPPTVIGDIVVIGNVIRDYHSGRSPNPPMEPGDVRAYHIRTGEQAWRFHTIPQPGEFGHETWPDSTWHTFGQANVWATISADPELGYVYLPVSAVSHQQYGGERPGANLFSDALVCVDGETGERIWHYQLIHHTLWNYDPPAAPILMDVDIDGEPRKIVVQLTKQAFAFVFDRVTGEPIWPIEERPVPQSTTPGEQSWPTQPFPTHPPPFDIQGLHEDDLRDLTPELRASAVEAVQRFGYAELYEPSRLDGAIVSPGQLGGADWVGGAFDPTTGMMYVPSKSLPSLQFLTEQDSTKFTRFGGTMRLEIPTPEGLPIARTPWGRITAFDMSTGDSVWVRPAGVGPVDHPALDGVEHAEELGWPTRTFVIASPGLLWAMSESPAGIGVTTGEYEWDREANLRVYDSATGALLSEIVMPDNATGGLLSYEANGRQYVAAATGGLEQPAEIVVLGVPRADEAVGPQAWAGYQSEHASFDAAVALFDKGDADGLSNLLAESPGLATARGNLDESYPLPELRSATLLHLIGGSVRAPLPANVIDLIDVMLAAGADPNRTTSAQETVLDIVVGAKRIRWLGARDHAIQRLLAVGATGGPQLLWRAMVGETDLWGDPLPDDHFDLARMLVDAGVPVDLPFAAAIGMEAEVEGFFSEDGSLQPGANVLFRPGHGPEATRQEVLDIALSYAVFGGHPGTVDQLLDRGADINSNTVSVRHSRGMNTALHKAALLGNVKMVRHLLARGADPTVTNSWGSLALDYARWAERDEAYAILEEAMENRGSAD